MTRKVWVRRLLAVLAAAVLLLPAMAAAAPNSQSGWRGYHKVDYPETHPLVPGQYDPYHYPVYDDVVSVLENWAANYPDIVTLYSGGTSFDGREIPQITISNKTNLPEGLTVDTRPAMFVGGNRHTGEVSARVAALDFANWLISGYGVDPEVTELVDNHAFYIRPMENPDGAEMYLTTAQTNRSTVRPYDQDGDGQLDEDPCNDLNRDGYCTAMRQFVGQGNGNYRKDPSDPSGRLMQSVGTGNGDYLYWSSEGVDDDKDDRLNEDGVGGLDLHRNYPENWRPMVEFSGYGYTQGGAGEYPLSETEMRSLVVFLLQHPNTAIAQTMDTSVPMHLRPPSTSKSEESMFDSDRAYYEHFDSTGKALSGYPWAGDVFWDYSNRNRQNPTSGSPLFGHSPDFGYFQFGAIWYGDELWGAQEYVEDFNGDGTINNLDRLWMNDNGTEQFPDIVGKLFIEWEPANHPDFGKVEIGGWNPKFWSQNSPAGTMLKEQIRRQTEFNKMLAASLPLVKQSGAPVVTDNGDGTKTVSWTLENMGFLPTALEQAYLVKVVRQDQAILTAGTGLSVSGGTKTLPFFGGVLNPDNRTQTVTWTVTGSGTATLTFRSTRGGRIITTVDIP